MSIVRLAPATRLDLETAGRHRAAPAPRTHGLSARPGAGRPRHRRTALAAPAGPPAVLHVGQIARQNVAAHGNCEPDTLVEPDIAVSPFNTKIEVAVAHDCRFATGGAVDISYAWTHDGGAHWHHAPCPG